jgi:hypothetical protein
MKRLTIQMLAFLLSALPLLGVYAKDISAASSRVAVIKELKGTVKLMVAAGVVTTQTTTPGDKPKNVLPTQNALITKVDKGYGNNYYR